MHKVLFHVGNYPVHSWGLLLMLGFAIAVWRAAKVGPRLYGIVPDSVLDVSLWGLLGGIIGGRIGYVLQNIPEFSANPGSIFAIWTGGMTSFGGFIGGIGAGVIVCQFRKIRISDMMDLAAVSLPIGYGIGRIGCFLNGCCYGGECDLPWAVNTTWDDGLIHRSHPAQLYSAFAALCIYLLLLPLERRRRFRGQIMLAFAFYYGVYRFFIEFIREGATAQLSSIAHLTTGQLMSLAVAVLAAILYAVLGSRRAAPVATPAA